MVTYVSLVSFKKKKKIAITLRSAEQNCERNSVFVPKRYSIQLNRTANRLSIFYYECAFLRKVYLLLLGVQVNNSEST